MPEAAAQQEEDETMVAAARCFVRDTIGQSGLGTAGQSGSAKAYFVIVAGSATVAQLIDEVAKQTKHMPDTFLLSLQDVAGGEVVLNAYLDSTLVEVGLDTGPQSRNKLDITDAPPCLEPRGTDVSDAPPPNHDEPVAWARCIVRDMTDQGDLMNKMIIDLAGSAKVAQLVDHVAKQTKYMSDKFLLSLQHVAGGEELVLNNYLDSTLVEVGLDTGPHSRNKLLITDARPRRKQRGARGLDSGDHAGRSSPVAPLASDTAATPAPDPPAYTYASGLIKSNETGYVGLVNQAMTCYLNSLLQTLFMTPEFRNAMYSWEYDGTQEDAAKSIPYQLQKLFVNMQTTGRASVETTELTYSFGWDSSEAWQQHDIQELCRVMFDALEVKFKDTEQHDLISRLYEGKMIDYVKCLECGTEKAREDTYLDIPLPIRLFGATAAFGSVEEALRGFVKPEILDGNNQYHCDNCGRKCDAHKGLKFKSFPYLLTLHLKRFDFDYQTLHRIKLNDRVSFPELLDLNSLLWGASGPVEGGDAARFDDAATTDSGAALDEEAPSATGPVHTTNGPAAAAAGDDADEGIDCSDSETRANNYRNAAPSGPHVYELFSIMIHAGSASGGHYYAYIKDFDKQQWFCFNDQSVTPVTQDDIRRTYGGGTRTSSYASSTNAYMLMYRLMDKQRNCLPLQTEGFPRSIQELLARMRAGEVQERANKERERNTCKLTLFGVHPRLRTTVSTAFHVHKDMTLEQATELGWKMLEFDKHVPLDRCRLVKYDDLNDAIEESLESQAGATMDQVMGGVRATYKFDLMLEWRADDAQFEVYTAGDTTLQVLRVDVSAGSIGGPMPQRASLSSSVADLRAALGLPPGARLCLARYCGDLRLLSSDDRPLKLEGVHRNSRVFVSVEDGDDDQKPFSESQFYRLCDQHEHTISLQVIVPKTDPESLERLAIPSLDQMARLCAEPQPRLGAEAPSELPTGIDLDCFVGAAPEAAATGERESPPASPEPAADELLSSDQSASEDSSATDSERTLIGGAPAAGRGSVAATPSNSPAGSDYQSMLSPQDESSAMGGTMVSLMDAIEGAYGPSCAPEQLPNVRRYFSVDRIQSHENGLLWDVRLDNRITLGGFKREIESRINVHRDYFKILKIYSSNQEFECTRLDDQLMTHGDNVTFVARLSRRLRDGELRGKVYKLEPNATEPSKFMFEWILRKGMPVEQAKKEILAEQRSRLGLDVPLQRCRLRKKNWKNPGKIYLDSYKFDKEVPLYPNWEIFVQELGSVEEVQRPGQLALFCRRFHPASYTLDDLEELVLPTATADALLTTLSERAGVPPQHLRLAKPPGSFPNDFNALLAPTELDWIQNVTALDVWPLNILEDGYVLYYKDGSEPLAELSEQRRREISQRETARLQARNAASSIAVGSAGSTATAPRREKALKIHVDCQPSAGD